MHSIALVDDIEVERVPGQSTHEVAWASDAPSPSAIDWPIDHDLAVRAHRLLESQLRRPLPIHLRIAKRIPVGGGLGGGSSDAAATLLALNDLFALGFSGDDLRALSQRLGSDVAFFLDDLPPALLPRPALVRGFGDRIERLPSRRHDALVLLFPPFGCPTPPVNPADDAAPRPLREAAVRALAGAQEPADLFNDLDVAAGAVAPALPPLRATLAAALGRPVYMTGSGSTLFALAPSSREAGALANQAASIPGIAAFPTHLT
jgi:4-diphosphocytidyl-2-C-methyl-D-erythritol kinase